MSAGDAGVTRLRVGLVGANPDRGWARDAHVPALETLDGFVVQAVSARTQAIADAAAAAFGAPAAFADSLALARDPDVDLVSVCVKVPEHRAIVLAALAAGKHVYCEWPLGRDTAEATEMAAAAAGAPGRVAIGLQGAQADAIREAGRLVADGAIGEPRSLNVVSPTGGWGAEMPAFYAYLQDRANGATLLSIPGGHTLAAIEAVVGAYIDLGAQGETFCTEVAISGEDRTVTRTGFDHLVVTGRHASGCASVLEVIGGTTSVPFRFDLRGSRGELTVAGGHPGGFQAGPLTLTVNGRAVPLPSGPDGPAANVATLYARFAGDIRGDTRVVRDFADAVRLHRLLDAVDEAAASGCRVALP